VAPTGEEMNIAMEYLLREKIPIYVCTPCAKARGITEDVLLDGAQYAVAKKLIELAAESKVFNF
jgi:sulfur relay (sulfurtransferase) complex TusBCD TusD component (DsrE family)